MISYEEEGFEAGGNFEDNIDRPEDMLFTDEDLGAPNPFISSPESQTKNPLNNFITAELQTAAPAKQQTQIQLNLTLSTFEINTTQLTLGKIHYLISSFTPSQQLEYLQSAYIFLKSLVIQDEPESTKFAFLNPVTTTMTSYLEPYQECKRLFALPSLAETKYKLTIIRLFQQTALNIISQNPSDPAILQFVARWDTFIDSETDYKQTVHWGRTHIRNQICDLVIKYTQPTVRYESNPLTGFLGDEHTTGKLHNKFNHHLLNYLLHNTNSPEDNLHFVIEAATQVLQNKLPYSSATKDGVIWTELKNLKFRHLGLLLDKIQELVKALTINPPRILPNWLIQELTQLRTAWQKSDEKFYLDKLKNISNIISSNIFTPSSTSNTMRNGSVSIIPTAIDSHINPFAQPENRRAPLTLIMLFIRSELEATLEKNGRSTTTQANLQQAQPIYSLEQTTLTKQILTNFLAEYPQPHEKLKQLEQAFQFVREQCIYRKPKANGVFFTVFLPYQETKELFELPAREQPPYVINIAELFQAVAADIIEKNIQNEKVLKFVAKTNGFLDFQTNWLKAIHFVRTPVRNAICQWVVNKTPPTIFYDYNPLLPYLGDNTNGETSKKRLNLFNEHMLDYLLHNTNTTLENLDFIATAYAEIVQKKIKYSPLPKGLKELKDLKYRHLGRLLDKFYTLANKNLAYTMSPPDTVTVQGTALLCNKLIMTWLMDCDNFHQDNFIALIEKIDGSAQCFKLYPEFNPQDFKTVLENIPNSPTALQKLTPKILNFLMRNTFANFTLAYRTVGEATIDQVTKATLIKHLQQAVLELVSTVYLDDKIITALRTDRLGGLVDAGDKSILDDINSIIEERQRPPIDYAAAYGYSYGYVGGFF